MKSSTAWTVFALLFVGCASTDDSGGEPRGETDVVDEVSGDMGADLSDGSAGEVEGGGEVDGGEATGCDNIVANLEADEVCTGAPGECSDGVCIQFTGEDDSTCRQECVPGECEEFCRGARSCLTVLEPGGGPRLREDGRVMGVCGVRPTGDLVEFDECGQDIGQCVVGTLCITIGGSATSICLPECTFGDCPEFEGMQSECVLQMDGGNRDFCGLICEDENVETGEGCPEGMICSAGSGRNFCLWPE
jgi:hypothetical protein